MKVVQARIEEHFRSYQAYVDTLTEEQLQQALPMNKHKTVGAHLWCVLGARESYAKALAAGSWQGFACSVGDLSVTAFDQGLQAAAEAVREAWTDVEWTPARSKLLLDLLEHEVMHQGQLIRHAHALGQPLPASWNWA